MSDSLNYIRARAVTVNKFPLHQLPTRQLWQAGQMAKAYRTDVLSKKRFQEEIQQRWKALKPEHVPCPLLGCECTYEMFGSRPANLVEYVAILQDRVKREHPDHTSEVLSVNEFRKVPR